MSSFVSGPNKNKSSIDIIKALNSGFLPNELNYSANNTSSDIDWDKLQYNTFWRDPSFWAKKFPPGWESIPGFESIFQHYAENSKSPLEEMEIRQSITEK
jgi:hypothetical protein